MLKANLKRGVLPDAMILSYSKNRVDNVHTWIFLLFEKLSLN